MTKLFSGAVCLNCAGCYKLRDPEFRGVRRCDDFSRAQRRVWCADETIQRFIRTRKIV